MVLLKVKVANLSLSQLVVLTSGVLALGILGMICNSAYALQPAGDLIGYSKSTITVVDKNTESTGCRDDQIKATHLVARDQNSSIIKQTTAGSQVSLEATIVSDCSLDQPATLIFEVRDAEGITNHMTWQMVAIDAKERITTGTSWVAPEKPGV